LSRSLKDRLWAKVAIPLDLDACWLWVGALSLKRYNQRRPVMRDADGRVEAVARIVCRLVNGPAPSRRHQAGHTCPDGENALCVSPRHLQWVTPYENQQMKRRRES
jgi:hypothetical protein